jgi:sarcosine oxidase subunit gamma
VPETRVAANDVPPPGEDAVTLAPLELGTVWNLRGDPANSAFVAEAARVLGLPLPLAPNASARDERGHSLLMLGPRSWLFVARHDAVRNDFDTARQRLNGAGGALFDVSASYVGWSVAGSDAARVLNRGSPLDLDPRVFPAGHCAQSLLGHIGALIHRPGDAPSFVVMVARSFSADAWRDLRDFAEP